MITKIATGSEYYDRCATGAVPIHRVDNGDGEFVDLVYLVKSLKADLWVLPKGGLEDGLTFEQNAEKETQEEGGLIVKCKNLVFDDVLSYDASNGFRPKLQREVYFLAEFVKVAEVWEERGLRDVGWYRLDNQRFLELNMNPIQYDIVRKAHDIFKAARQFPVCTSHRA